MKIIKNFNNYMKNKLNEFNTDPIMICPYCDGRGYIKDKEDKSQRCKPCKGKGIIDIDKQKKEIKF